MILTIFTYAVGLLWLIATIAIAIWWRSHFTYVYFGGADSMFRSWLGTLVGSFFASSIFIAILYYPAEWMIKHGLRYLPDIIVLVGGLAYFIKRKNASGNSSGGSDANDVDETN